MTHLKKCVFFPSSFCTIDKAVIATEEAFRDRPTLTVFAYLFFSNQLFRQMCEFIRKLASFEFCNNVVS